MPTTLEQSLADDIAAEQAALQPKADEKAAEVIADEVVEKVNKEAEQPPEEAKPAEPAPVDDDEQLPENPTKEDFARQRVKAKQREKELEERLRKAEEDKARQQGYIAAKNEAQPVKEDKPDPALADPEPDIELNPREWKSWKQRQDDARFDEMKKSFQQIQVTSRIKDTIANAKQEEATYAKQNPTYNDAKAYLDQKAMDNIRANNPFADEAAIKAKLVQDEYAAILEAKQKGINTAIYFEMLAKNAGFQPKAPEAKEPTLPERKPNMEAIKRNKEKSVTLAGSRSNAAGLGEPTDEEFAELTLMQIAAMKR